MPRFPWHGALESPEKGECRVKPFSISENVNLWLAGDIVTDPVLDFFQAFGVDLASRELSAVVKQTQPLQRKPGQARWEMAGREVNRVQLMTALDRLGLLEPHGMPEDGQERLLVILGSTAKSMVHRGRFAIKFLNNGVGSMLFLTSERPLNKEEQEIMSGVVPVGGTERDAAKFAALKLSLPAHLDLMFRVAHNQPDGKPARADETIASLVDFMGDSDTPLALVSHQPFGVRQVFTCQRLFRMLNYLKEGLEPAYLMAPPLTDPADNPQVIFDEVTRMLYELLQYREIASDF